jgi:hypothetical protein
MTTARLPGRFQPRWGEQCCGTVHGNGSRPGVPRSKTGSWPIMEAAKCTTVEGGLGGPRCSPRPEPRGLAAGISGPSKPDHLKQSSPNIADALNPQSARRACGTVTVAEGGGGAYRWRAPLSPDSSIASRHADGMRSHASHMPSQAPGRVGVRAALRSARRRNPRASWPGQCRTLPARPVRRVDVVGRARRTPEIMGRCD